MDFELIGELLDGGNINYISKLAPFLNIPDSNLEAVGTLECVEGRLYQLEQVCSTLGLKMRAVTILLSKENYQEILLSVGSSETDQIDLVKNLFGKKYQIKLSIDPTLERDIFYIMPLSGTPITVMLGKQFSMLGNVRHREISISQSIELQQKAFSNGLVFELEGFSLAK